MMRRLEAAPDHEFSHQMVPLSVDANVTHARYGTISDAASRETRHSAVIVATIVAHNIRISRRAQPGSLQAKNTQDQSEFKTSWPPNQPTANRTAAGFSARRFHVNQAETAIIV